MRLVRPQPAPALSLRDLDGRPVEVASGRRLLLSIFREASCPFCNFRVFELTHNYRDLRELGLDVVVIFASEEDEVRRFIARQPRPFRIVADPESLFDISACTALSLWACAARRSEGVDVRPGPSEDAAACVHRPSPSGCATAARQRPRAA